MSAVDFGRCARTSTPPLRQSAARFEGRGEWLGPSCAHLAAPAPSLASTASAPENRACSPPAGASVALRRCARAHGWSSRPPPRCRRPRIASRSPRWRARQARAHSARVTSRLRARGTLACSWASQWPARPRERSRRPGARIRAFPKGRLPLERPGRHLGARRGAHRCFSRADGRSRPRGPPRAPGAFLRPSRHSSTSERGRLPHAHAHLATSRNREPPDPRAARPLGLALAYPS